MDKLQLLLRQRKEFDKLSRSQRSARVQEAQQVLQALKVPPAALVQLTPAPPSTAILLSKTQRVALRKVTQLTSERSLISFKLQLAATHGTATECLSVHGKHGAYVTDPLRLIHTLAASSPFLCVGGDYGRDSTKLGISYLDKEGQLAFAAVLVYEGKDNFDSLSLLNSVGVCTFAGETASVPACTTIFSVLQHLFDSLTDRLVFLNGDMAFLNVVLGLKNCASLNPCPICVVDKSKFLVPVPAPFRLPDLPVNMYSKIHEPLLRPSPVRIVPPPLHILLGLGNLIIKESLPKYVDAAILKAAVDACKTHHSDLYSGAAAAHGQLNGPELSRFIRSDSLIVSTPNPSVHLLMRWLRELHDHLLHKEKWTPAQHISFQQLVCDINNNWTQHAHDRATPKLHMLTHASAFAANYHYLGLYSESQLEHYHSTFSHLFRHTHRNQGDKSASRMRRSLADTLVKSAAPSVAST